MQTYKIEHDNNIKNLGSDILVLKNESKLVRTNIDSVKSKLTREISNIRTDIPNYTQTFLKKKLSEHKGKTNADIQKIGNKLVSGLTNITSRIERLWRNEQ